MKKPTETGQYEIYELSEDEQVKPEEDRKDKLIDELGELNDNEKAILERMRGVKQGPTSKIPKSETDWISVSVGQTATIAGLNFKISHISKGFLVLEAGGSPQKEEEEADKESVWTQLQCTGARSLIRIDGTPFYVETRILSMPNEDTKEENPGE